MAPPLPGETLAAIEEEFEFFRRVNEEFIDRSKGLLVKLEPFGGEVSGQFSLDDKCLRPIQNKVRAKRREPLNTIIESAQTGNDAVERIVLVFGFLRNEVRVLKEKMLHSTVPFLLLFGETMGAEGNVVDGNGHLKFAQGIKPLVEACELVERTKAVLTNLVQQCFAIHADSGDNLALYKTFQDVGLKSVMMSVGTCLYILLMIDSAIKYNPLLLTCSSMFQGSLNAVGGQADKYGISEGELEKLSSDLQSIDRLISAQGNLQYCIEHVLTEIELSTRSIKPLMRQMHSVISESLGQCIQRSENGSHSMSPYENELLLQNLCLTILYTWISGDSTDKKLLRLSMDASKAIPAVPLHAHMLLITSDLLEQHLHPSWLREKPQDFRIKAKKNQHTFLSQLDESFVSRCKSLIKDLTSWCITVDDDISAKMDSTDIFAYALKTLKDGLGDVCALQATLITFLELHTHLEKPVNKGQIKMVCQAAAMLKIVEKVFNKRSYVLLQMMPYMLSTVQSKMYSTLEPLRRKLEAEIAAGPKKGLKGFLSSSKDADEVKLDAYALVSIALHSLDGPTSSQRIALISFIFDLLKDLEQIKGSTATDLMILLSLLNLLYDYQSLLEAKCDCSFLIFSSDILGEFLTELFEDLSLHSQVYFVVNAFHDGKKLIVKSGLEESCLVEFSKNLESIFLEKFVSPLHRAIENDLRFHLHSERIEGMTKKNPVKDKQSDVTPLLKIDPIAFHDSLISVRDQITHYLNQDFYNHAAIGLQNWKTYNEMLNLAENKYGLKPSEIHLPQQTLEQGLDVLEVMRNIHIFVVKYSYNLHLQTFVEKLADSIDRKHLNTISIRHVANSIRSHGIGIVNTTINYVYQYLTKKLEVLTTFLYDDHIRSRLKREIKFFNDNQDDLDHEYPFERAESFNKDIRKLGVTANGLTYMDKFRAAITEVGNALGFVRMMRLGAMRYCSQAIEFLPPQDIPSSSESCGDSFAEQAKIEVADQMVLNCSEQVDSLMENLQTKSAETLDYLNLLVSVFSKELCNERFSHLQDFHIILPSVTLNAIESLLKGKEKLSKRGVDSDATFSDDGFALGLAYLLKVLKQVKIFNDIHWFDAVRKHYAQEMDKLQAASKQSSRRSSFFSSSVSNEDRNAQLLLARYEGHLEEFNFLEWTLRAANTFFHNQ